MTDLSALGMAIQKRHERLAEATLTRRNRAEEFKKEINDLYEFILTHVGSANDVVIDKVDSAFFFDHLTVSTHDLHLNIYDVRVTFEPYVRDGTLEVRATNLSYLHPEVTLRKEQGKWGMFTGDDKLEVYLTPENLRSCIIYVLTKTDINLDRISSEPK